MATVSRTRISTLSTCASSREFRRSAIAKIVNHQSTSCSTRWVAGPIKLSLQDCAFSYLADTDTCNNCFVAYNTWSYAPKEVLPTDFSFTLELERIMRHWPYQTRLSKTPITDLLYIYLCIISITYRLIVWWQLEISRIGSSFWGSLGRKVTSVTNNHRDTENFKCYHILGYKHLIPESVGLTR